jgi:hypothetical protein
MARMMARERADAFVERLEFEPIIFYEPTSERKAVIERSK